MLSNYGITSTLTTSYNPQGNSIIERAHRTLKDRIIASRKGWINVLQESVYAINTTESSTTGLSPFESIFGRVGSNPRDWPSVTRKDTFEVTNKPFIGEFVSIRCLPSVGNLCPKFSGRFQVIARPSSHTALLDNQKTYNLRNLRSVL